jgi:hypothetical protein
MLRMVLVEVVAAAGLTASALVAGFEGWSWG